MYHRPCLDQFQSPTRQLTLEHRRCVDIDGCFEFSKPGMKVWRGMVVENTRIKIPARRYRKYHNTLTLIPPIALP